MDDFKNAGLGTFEEELQALVDYGHDCCARIDDKIHECCERIKKAHDVEVGGYEMALGWNEMAHCVELPKDADGEYIRIGDMMEWVRYKDDDPTIVRTVSGIGNSVFFAWSDEQGRYAQYEAHAYRHHHEPTVEVEVENAKLQEQGARLFDKTLELADENAKLRKLVNIMAIEFRDMSNCFETPCPECPVRMECDCEQQLMSELGIEVDDGQ